MTPLIEGINVFKIRAKTRAGIWGPSFSFSVIINTTPPVITNARIESTAPDGRIKADQTSFILEADSIVDPTDGVAKTRFYRSNDGIVWSKPVEYDGVQLSHQFDEVDLKADNIHGKIEAEDNAGNMSEAIVSKEVIYVGPFDYSKIVGRWSNLPGQGR